MTTTHPSQVFTPEAGDRPDVRDILILVTDGVPTREADSLIPETQRLKDQGVRIIAVGVTNQVG